MEIFTIIAVAAVLFYTLFSFFQLEYAEYAASYRNNAIRKEEAKLKASMVKVAEYLKLLKEFEAKGYKSTTAYYRNELAQQRTWMNYYRSNLAALKG